MTNLCSPLILILSNEAQTSEELPERMNLPHNYCFIVLTDLNTFKFCGATNLKGNIQREEFCAQTIFYNIYNYILF